MKLDSKPGLILSLFYLGILALSGIYTLYPLIFHAANSEFSGRLLTLVTLPWSMMTIPILDSLRFITWADNPVVYWLLALLPLLLAALVNATILYFIGRLFSNIAKSENSKNGNGTILSTDKVNSLWKKFNLFFWTFFIMLSFDFYLQIVLPLPQYNTLINTLWIVAKVGSIVTLSYFGYATTLKKKYILLGLLGLFSFTLSIGLIVGYIILWQAKKKVIASQSVPSLS